VNGSPTEVVATAFSALESEDWSRLAELTHPDALAEYRSHQIANPFDARRADGQ